MKNVQIVDAAGCLHCGEPFTMSSPSTHWIPMRNPVRRLRVYVPVHAACEQQVQEDQAVRALLSSRLDHMLDSHQDLIRNGKPG